MIILGLGSNWGDRVSFLRRAIHRLKSSAPETQIQAISPIYESSALLPPNAPPSWDRPFLNLNVLCSSPLSSPDLLKLLKRIEAEIGRENRGRWAPREIDIDILARNDEVFSQSDLTIPHPGLLKRPFAFLPFSDLAPDWQFPSAGPFFGKKISEILPTSSTLDAVRSNQTLTEVMGILNITPDSFSDGDLHARPETVLETVKIWCQQGVRILDLGAESTRPDAIAISPSEECKRLEPILNALQTDSQLQESHLILSLDTRNPEVATWAIPRGIHWINDVSGFDDPKMTRIVADSGGVAVFMHSLSVPSRRDLVIPEGVDPVDLILKWAEQKIQELLQQGVSREKLIFDPGLGFGKTPAQNWQIVRQFKKFHQLGVKTLVGHSRKSFLANVSNVPPRERDLETAALSIDLFEKGVDYLRVHEPVLNSRALIAWSHANGVVRCQT